MGADENSLTIDILVTSDLHGHLFPTDYRSSEERPFGLGKLAALIERERRGAEATLLIDNGDLLQGSPLAYYCAKLAGGGEHPCVAALNRLRYDAAVIGNHEFNYGRALLDRAVRDAEFPWLSANTVDLATGGPAFGKPYIVKTFRGGVKAAVLGVTTHYVPNWEQPEHIEGLEFRDALSAVKQWAEYIRREERPDVLIVAYHGGFERDLESGRPTEPDTGENQGYAMLLEAAGIDVLITGHQHRSIAAVVRGVACVQPSCNGQALGKVSVTLTRRDGGWTVARKDVRLLEPNAETPADVDVLSVADELERRTQAWLDQPLGVVEGAMSIADPMAARAEEHPFIEFVNRVQMEAASVDISCTALFADECRGFGEQVTMRDILGNYMFPNTLKVLRLSGRDIRAALERSAAYFTVGADGRLSVHPSFLAPKPQHYNYDMWEGIDYRLDVSKPVGERVVMLERHGRPIDPDASYDVVMNNYRAAGGGEYPMFRDKPVVKEIPFDMVELLANAIMERRVVVAACNRNWAVVYGASASPPVPCVQTKL